MNYTTLQDNILNQEQIQNLKLQYGCYLKVLDVTTTSLGPLLQKDNFRMMFAIGCIIFGVINIAVNSLLLIGLIKTTKKQNFFNKLFIYLTCTDLIAGCILMPTLVYYQLVGLTCPYMTAMMCCVAFVCAGDATTVLMISFMRLQTIRNPLKHETGFKKKFLFISIQNMFPLFLAISFIVTYYVRGTIEDFQLVGYISNGVMTSLSLTVIVSVLMTLFHIKKHIRRNTKTFESSTLAHHKKSTGSLLIIGSMMIFFIIVQSPVFYILHMLLRSKSLLSGKTFRLTKKMVDVTVLVNLLNTSMNSIVIIWRSKEIKNYYRKRFLCKSWSSDTQTTSELMPLPNKRCQRTTSTATTTVETIKTSKVVDC